MSNFLDIDSFIQEWNADTTHTHVVGHNNYSDWTAEERAKLTKHVKGTNS
jgi:hypothetical protein